MFFLGIFQANFLDPRIIPGSVCRRQSTEDILHVLRPLAALHLRLHGFGMKTTGLQFAAHLLISADSAAWSRAARYDGHRPHCTRPTSRHHGRPFQPAQCPGCAVIFYNSLHHHFPDNPPLPTHTAPNQPTESREPTCPSPPSALPPPAPSRTEPAVTAANDSNPPPSATATSPAPSGQPLPLPPTPCLPVRH